MLRGIFDHIVLFVGRFEEQKDLHTLFHIIERVAQNRPRTLFLIIGDGKKRAEVQDTVKKIGIQNHVIFMGWIDYFDLPKYYAICDAFILTSLYETSPRVVIFACLSRKPIVTTDVSGVRDFVKEGENGFIAPIKDEEGLAKGILTLLENPARAKQMGERGFERIQELLNEENILQDYEKMWQFTSRARDKK